MPIPSCGAGRAQRVRGFGGALVPLASSQPCLGTVERAVPCRAMPCFAVPCHAVPARDFDPPPRASWPLGVPTAPVRLLAGLQLSKEGKMLKSRGQMGQLVTVTQAGLGSGLPALRGCGSAMKPIFSGERKAAGAQRRASARRGRGRCEQPSSTPPMGLRVANAASNPSQNSAEPQDEELGGLHFAACPGTRTGAGPHRGAGGSFATGSGCGSAPSRSHPWQGGTEAPAFPSLASLVVLIREAGAGSTPPAAVTSAAAGAA